MNKPAPRSRPRTDEVRARFTAAEFLHMAGTGAFDDMKVELIEGELARTNPPMNEHGRSQAQIAIRRAAAIGETLLRGETGIEVKDDTVLACDVAVLKAPVDGRRPLRPEDLLLVVEIALTTLGRDMGVKRAAYARAAVPNYWVVDGERRVVHLFAEPVAGDYVAISSVRFGDPLPVPGTMWTSLID